MTEKPARRPRVLIVGAGFGGLAAAKRLAGQPVDVTIIDQRNYHLSAAPLSGRDCRSLTGRCCLAHP